MANVGTINAIWRYPVKSMMGEEVDSSAVTEQGVLGDRAYALVDAETGKIASAKNPKRWPNLFQCHATLTEPPENARSLPPVRITLPDGATVTSDDPGVDEALSALVGRRVTLESTAPAEPVLEEYWPDMDGVSPEGHRDTVTDERIGMAAPAGTFFDLAPMGLLTTATLDRLGELYPQGRFDVRRFRMNLIVDVDEDGFVENGWIGRTLEVGDGVSLPVTIADPRCVMITLPQGDLPKDPGILRTAAQHNRVEIPGAGPYPCVGVYATVAAGGNVSRGDPVAVD
jgi:MOSC domain-containing protein